MLLQKPNDLSNKSSIEPSATDVGFVHGQLAFTSILRLEQMRSDRSGTTFALSVFSFKSELDCDQFQAHVVGRRRATDHIGRMSRKKIGVVLWDTSTEGAWKFADKVIGPDVDAFAGDREIFVYPTKWLSNDFEVAHENYDPLHAGPVCDSAVEPALAPQSQSAATATLTVPRTQPKSVIHAENSLALTEELIQLLMDDDGDLPVTAPSTQPMEPLFAQPLPLWKRTIDIAGATCGLILLAPLFVVVATIIKLTSAGPLIFSQRRSGRAGIPFTMYKFRSMVADAEEQQKELAKNNAQDGPAFKMESDPRITSIGHFIRRTSIDELPQLWNVLRGEMSLVGPRPLLCEETEVCEAWQKRRLEVTPGLTCIWQVQDDRTRIPFADWARMDIRYIRSRTLKNDAALVLKTFRSIFGRKGS
ncbi:MAG: sugar transferase [Fuerstiella sp.]